MFVLEDDTVLLPPTSNPDLPRVAFVTAHGVGVKAYVKGHKANYVLIHKNTRVPCKVSRTFTTKANKDGTARNRLPIQVTQGDTPNLELAEVLGTGEITGIPPNESAGQPVRVTMAFDIQGRLDVHAVYVKTGQELSITMEIPGGLAEEQVEEFKTMMIETGLIDPPVASDPLIQQFEMEFDEEPEDDDDIPFLEPVD